MRLTRYVVSVLLASILLTAVLALTAEAALVPGPVITVPGNPLASTDIMWVDSSLGRLFLADRSNVAVDVFDTRANAFIGSIPTKPTTANGVATDPAHHVFWGGTNSTLNVADGAGLRSLASISTGGTGRADELAVDPRDQEVLIANDQDSPPFLTLVSYTPLGLGVNLKILGKLPLPQALGGIEQPVWDPGQGLFLVAIPNFNGTPAVISVSPAPLPSGGLQLVKVFPLPTCTGATGLALGPSERFLVGCAPHPVIMSGTSGAVLATIPTGNPDEVWFNPGNNQFLNVSNTTQDLVSVDATALTVIDDIPVGANHNVTADSVNNEVFVLLRAGNPKCPNGCIAVFTDPPDSGGLPAGAASTLLPGSPASTNPLPVGAAGTLLPGSPASTNPLPAGAASTLLPGSPASTNPLPAGAASTLLPGSPASTNPLPAGAASTLLPGSPASTNPLPAGAVSTTGP